jgi:glyoxylase-like metal-dependent hydrolase (beta-lactamase superfamily II)
MEIKIYGQRGMACNTYLVIDSVQKQGFLVDAGIYDSGLVQEARERGVTVTHLILTHGHGDHIGGVEGYRQAFPGLVVVAHEEEVSMLENPNMNFSREIWGKEIVVKADYTVKDGDMLELGTFKLDFIHTPGHTKGGMCILVDQVLFSGDTLFQSSIGRTDFPGGNFEEIKNSIRNKLFVLPDDTDVFPGHMDPTNIGFEKENNFFV